MGGEGEGERENVDTIFGGKPYMSTGSVLVESVKFFFCEKFTIFLLKKLRMCR